MMRSLSTSQLNKKAPPLGHRPKRARCLLLAGLIGLVFMPVFSAPALGGDEPAGIRTGESRLKWIGVLLERRVAVGFLDFQILFEIEVLEVVRREDGASIPILPKELRVVVA